MPIGHTTPVLGNSPFTPDDGTPQTILGQIHSSRRGLLLLTHISDTPMVLKPDELILWGLGCAQWYLTLGPSVPDWKLAALAQREGISFDELVRLRDELVGVELT